jgi:hypothetical protein
MARFIKENVSLGHCEDYMDPTISPLSRIKVENQSRKHRSEKEIYILHEFDYYFVLQRCAIQAYLHKINSVSWHSVDDHLHCATYASQSCIQTFF